MYTPNHFAETRLEILHGLIASHPLATVVTGEPRLEINHIPFLVEASEGDKGVLKGHVARANPLWKSFSGSVETAFIFQGPNHYISPNWYPSKRDHGKVVPTWNFAVVHAFGVPRLWEDPSWLRAHLSELTDAQESTQASPWRVSDAPEEYIEANLRALVGIEVPISSISGKWKLSQNRQEDDREGVIAGLESQDSRAAREMAVLMRSSAEEG